MELTLLLNHLLFFFFLPEFSNCREIARKKQQCLMWGWHEMGLECLSLSGASSGLLSKDNLIQNHGWAGKGH